MKIYTKPQLTVLGIAVEDVLTISLDSTFLGLADNGMGYGMGYGVDVDFDLLRKIK